MWLFGPCECARNWRIRKDGAAQRRHPWVVYRLLDDGHYEVFMHCRSFTAAVQLVTSMLWLATGSAAATMERMQSP